MTRLALFDATVPGKLPRDPRNPLPGVTPLAELVVEGDGWTLTYVTRAYRDCRRPGGNPSRPSGQARHFLDVVATKAQAHRLLHTRSFADGQPVITVCGSRIRVGGIALEWDEGTAILGGADPRKLLLPVFTVRSLTAREMTGQ